MPEAVVTKAKVSGCQSIAYTYTEPTVFYEYTLDTAQIAKTQNIKNVMHSNGYINPKPLERLCKYLDAANIDLKAFTQDFYGSVSSGILRNVLQSLKIIKEQGVWLELTNLVIPTLNDDHTQIKQMCEWVCKNLGTEVPIHFSRFHPTYKLTSLPPTSTTALVNARNIAIAAGLKYLYIGNLPGHKAESTFCPDCNKILIKRAGYIVQENLIKKNKCPECGTQITGIWS